MLGSLTEADDAVQEAWLRLSRQEAAAIENLGGWLTTVVARICLNVLKARRSRREELIGVRLPDPVVSPEDELDPEQEALLADSVGLALLVVLETLEPAERLELRAARRWRRQPTLLGGGVVVHACGGRLPAGARCARWFSAERREVGMMPARPVDWAPHPSSQSLAGVSV